LANGGLPDDLNGSLRASGPGGFAVQARGPLVVVLLVLLVGFITLGAILRTDGAMRQDEHRALLSAQRDLGCILALPQEVRPDSLRDPEGVCHYVVSMYQWHVAPKAR
jgi:hypothetical protein